MIKVRIFDLSKILDVSNKDLMDYLRDVKGLDIKSHSSSIDQALANEIIAEFRRKKKAEKEGKKFVPRVIEKPQPPAPEKSPVIEEKKIEEKPAQLPVESPKSTTAVIEAIPEKPVAPAKIPVPQKPSTPEKQPVPAKKAQAEKEVVLEKSGAPAEPKLAPLHQTPGVSEKPETTEKPATIEPTTASTVIQKPTDKDDTTAKGKTVEQKEKTPTTTEKPPVSEKASPKGDLIEPKTTKMPIDKEPTQLKEAKQTQPKSQKIPIILPEEVKGPEAETSRRKKKRRRGQKSDAGEEMRAPVSPKPKAPPPPIILADDTIIDRKEKLTKQIRQTMTKTFAVSPRDLKGKKGKEQGPHVPEVTKKESTVRWMELPDSITVGDLAKKLEVSANELIKMLMNKGIMASINHNLNFDLAAQLVKKYGFRVERKKVEETKPEEEIDDPKLLSPRPPVVTVLGHVDHGKTSLLDYIRKTNVAAQESGGITQSIGAYTVEVGDRKIVFLDTPGHEAFTAMRARGAKVTDIAVLVVAADDGVMPQTVEAINHAKAAGVPIIVAINKVDKVEANPERVKQQLAEHDLVSEDWGGDVITVPVSAKTGAGIDDLLEMILLVADVQELKANPHRPAEGTIIESSMDVGLGPIATVVVQNGTLKVGDVVVVGNEWGRIKLMLNDKGKRVKKVFPSMPAKIIGLSGVPEAGDHLQVVADEKEAKEISEKLKEASRDKKLLSVTRASLDDIFRQMQEGEVKDLNIILKADVQGSVEALRHALQRLSNNEVNINIIHGGVGAINKSDVMLANASNAIIIGFNVRPDPVTKRMAEQEHVDIRLYRVIYHIIDDIKSAMLGLLEPEFEEVLLGRAEVRAVFKITKAGMIAGSYVTEGKIVRGAKARIIRDGVVIFEGKIDSLRRFKDDVKEVESNFECGIGIEKFGGFQPGDIIEAYTLQEVKRELPEPDSDSR